MLYRYELYIDGEYQDVGIFQELDNTFSYERAKDLAWPFDRKLQIPPYSSFKEQHTVSFFTEKGKQEFEKDIKAIIEAYEEESCFEIKTLIINEDDICHDIIWSDEYQVIVSEDVVYTVTR